MQHSIVYFPDYAHANPYQTLLYGDLDAIFTSQYGSIHDARLKLQRQAWDNRVIFHLHWEDAVYRHLPSAEEALSECQRFLDQLEAFVDGGGLFLWTRAQPGAARRPLSRGPSGLVREARDARRPDPPAFLCRARGARTRPDARSRQGHGDPARQLPAALPQPRAHRGDAGAAGRRFLLFGRLGRYKGGEGLVQSFAALKGGNARLTVAGKQIDPIDLASLPPTVSARITVHNRFLSEGDLLQAFEEADFVVSPYLASLTSGTVMLAMSLARPVIVPALPTLAELVIDGDNGLIFAPDQPGALGAALERAEQMSAPAWREMAARAFATAKRYDWRVIGHQLSGMFYRLIARPRVRHAPGNGPAEA